MNGINRVQIMGNLGADIELNSTKGGTPVATLSIATNERVKRDGEWTDHTEWHRVVVWGNTAQACSEHLARGSGVFVEGHLRTRKWQDADGKDRYTTEVEAERVVFVGGGGGDQGDREQDRRGNERQGRQERDTGRDQGGRQDRRGNERQGRQEQRGGGRGRDDRGDGRR